MKLFKSYSEKEVKRIKPTAAKVMALEDKLGVRIPDQELENLKQVKDIVACIEKYRG